MDNIKDIIIQVETLKLSQQFDDAISLLQQSIVKYNSDYRLYEELADIYLYQGKLDKANSAIDFALELNEQSATWNYLKGFILLSNDAIKTAIDYLKKSNQLMANNAEVLRNLWWAYTLTGEHHKGITILKRALNLSPEDELIVEDLAMALIGSWEIQSGNSLLQKIGKKQVTG